MAAEIPTKEPAVIFAGDTLKFDKSLADYSATDGWSLIYYLVNSDASINFTSTANGSDHRINVAKDATALWVSGIYQITGYAVSSTERVKIYGQSTIEIKPDPANGEAIDTRSQNRRTLDNVNAVIEGRASSTILNSEVEGTRLDRIPMADLLLLRDRFAAIVQREELAAQGLPTRRNIFVRFTNP